MNQIDLNIIKRKKVNWGSQWSLTIKLRSRIKMQATNGIMELPKVTRENINKML